MYFFSMIMMASHCQGSMFCLFLSIFITCVYWGGHNNQTNIFMYVSRYQLAEIIPGLRPWEVLSIEQAMDQITYGGQWYREPLGSYTTGPPYIRHWNKDVKVNIDSYLKFWIISLSLLELYGYVQVLKQTNF